MPLSDLWSGADPEPEQEEEQPSELESLKRQARTQKARAALALKRSEQKVEKAIQKANEAQQPQCDASAYARRLQEDFLSPSAVRTLQRSLVSCDSHDPKRRAARERSRCVWSLLQTLCRSVVSFLVPQSGSTVQHVFNTCVADDTNTTLKAVGSKRNAVYTVMNTTQTASARFHDGSWNCFFLPTPLQVLNSTKADTLHASFRSWLLVTADGCGGRWQGLGIPAEALDPIPWRTMVMIGDSLKANDSCWKTERAFLQASWRDSKAKLASSGHAIGFRVRCANHQIGLVRKPAVLAVPKYWSTLVRLGHLFETMSFRRSVAAGIVGLIQSKAFQRSLAILSSFLVGVVCLSL